MRIKFKVKALSTEAKYSHTRLEFAKNGKSIIIHNRATQLCNPWGSLNDFMSSLLFTFQVCFASNIIGKRQNVEGKDQYSHKILNSEKYFFLLLEQQFFQNILYIIKTDLRLLPRASKSFFFYVEN